MIPEFPEFKHLELSDKEEIESITKQFPPHSEFHFTSIFCWDVDNTSLISKLNDNLILKQNDSLTDKQYFSFIGINAVPQTVREISNYLYQNKLPLTLRWVPEETVKCLDGIEATITEDRDYFDYIYNVNDFITATGKKYKNYRKSVSQFTRSYNNISTRLLDITSNETKVHVNNLFKTWKEKKDFTDNSCRFSMEHKAFNKLLHYSKDITSLISLGVFDKDVLIAFSIDDTYNLDYGCGLFWKADTSYVGLYQFLLKEIINQYNRIGLKLMSFESDCGLESLRTSKLHYHPSYFLKKYKIELCIPN